MPEIETNIDELTNAKQAILQGLYRYPLARKAMLRIISQVPSPQLEQATEILRKVDKNPETGEYYLSEVPVSFGKPGAAKIYRTEYRDVLDPFIHPASVGMLIDDGKGRVRERLKILRVLSSFPILNPSLMQTALDLTATYFRQDLEYLIGEHIVGIWHPTIQDRELLYSNVTARGVRYYLLKHEERLRPFLSK